MFGRRQSRADRVRHDARSLAQRGIERGRHRAEALRETLPEPAELISDLRQQAEPVIRAAREQVEKAPATRKKSRSKKPLLLLALAVAGAVIAYFFFTRRDHEPAYLKYEPKSPDESPAEPSTPGGVSQNGPSPDVSPNQPPAPTNGTDVPERVSAFMASQPAQPTQASSSAMPATSPEPQATTFRAAEPQSPVEPTGVRYAPRAQVAAWDLPPSSVPPMRGGSIL